MLLHFHCNVLITCSLNFDYPSPKFPNCPKIKLPFGSRQMAENGLAVIFQHLIWVTCMECALFPYDIDGHLSIH